MSDNDDLERMATTLEQTGRYEVLRQFTPLQEYAAPDDAHLLTGLAVDVETTGTDHRRDKIIQFCGVPFQYSPVSGQIYTVGAPLTFLEDPGVDISADITALTSLTTDDVRGQKINEAAVNALVESASFVVAHNAKFDRPFLERRLPVFMNQPWACSLNDIAWPIGSGSAKLEFLLYKHCGMFFDAHTADGDCLALIHLLATPWPSGALPLQLLLAALKRETVRVWAINATYDKKDLLKARRYKWNNGEDGRSKAWYLDVADSELDAELDWLRTHIYNGRTDVWKLERFGATQRYSDRG